MPTFLVIVAAICGVLIYFQLCLLVLVYVTTPASLVALCVGVFSGLVVALVATTRVLTGRYPATRILTPAGPAAGRPTRRNHPDPAWPHYFTAQVRLDLWAVCRLTHQLVRPVCVGAVRPFLPAGRRKLLLAWPLLLVAVEGLAGLVAGAVAGLLLVALVLGVMTAVAWLFGLPVSLALRATDRAWQRIFRAGGSCPRCYEVTALPAYRCPGEHSTDQRRRGEDLHRDLRPGRYGVLWRRCACGTRLPTTVLRASWSLQAHCPSCTAPLHPGAAVATDIRIPVFGASSAGKTQLLMATLVALVGPDPAEPPGSPGAGRSVTLADAHSRRRYDEYLRLVRDDLAAPKTDVAQQPVAVTVTVPTRRNGALVHLFDAAGEALVDEKTNSGYSYLDYARTLLFVLDPFSVPGIRERAGAEFASVVAEANPAQHDPEDSYQSTVTRLRRYGVATDRQRLAFVVTKYDLIRRLPVGAELATDPAAVRDWLLAQGLDNLVVAAERDFAEVRFFLVSSKDLAETGALEPVRWLLSTERVAVTTHPAWRGHTRPGGTSPEAAATQDGSTNASPTEDDPTETPGRSSEETPAESAAHEDTHPDDRHQAA